MEGKQGIFEKIVKEALQAHPHDAHLYLLKYVQNSGSNAEHILKLKESYSKISVANEAFGKKDNPVKPKLFAEELRRELQKTLEVNQAFQHISENQNEKLHDLLIDHNILTEARHGICDQPQSSGGIEEESELITMKQCHIFRDSLRTFKLFPLHECKLGFDVWNLPLHHAFYGNPAVFKGIIEKGNKKSFEFDIDIPPYLITNQLIGFSISPYDVIYQERMWTSYSILTQYNNLLPTHIFPIVVGSTRDPITCGTTIFFEDTITHSHRLKDLTGPMLSNMLRTYPSIVQAWSNQLSNAIDFFRSKRGQQIGYPLNEIKVEDVFIKESGLLLIGNLSFAATSNPSSDHSLHLYDMASQILANSLSLSRHEIIYLNADPYLLSEIDEANYLNSFHNQVSNEANEFYSSKPGTFSLVSGSIIEFSFRLTRPHQYKGDGHLEERNDLQYFHMKNMVDQSKWSHWKPKARIVYHKVSSRLVGHEDNQQRQSSTTVKVTGDRPEHIVKVSQSFISQGADQSDVLLQLQVEGLSPGMVGIRVSIDDSDSSTSLLTVASSESNPNHKYFISSGNTYDQSALLFVRVFDPDHVDSVELSEVIHCVENCFHSHRHHHTLTAPSSHAALQHSTSCMLLQSQYFIDADVPSYAHFHHRQHYSRQSNKSRIKGRIVTHEPINITNVSNDWIKVIRHLKGLSSISTVPT